MKDRVVLVTGSTTGIGEAVARRCVAEGARVMVHGLEEELAQAVCVDLGEAAAYCIGDLADPAFCDRLVHETVAAWGKLDGIVNNAALTSRATLEETDVTFFDRMIAVNLRAPLLIIRAALPALRAQGGGAIVNIGSSNALGGQPNLVAYSMAKGGLATMTRNLSNALATERIRVNQVNPGWIATPNEIQLKQREGLPPGWHLNLPPEYAPWGRLTAPEEIAGHVLFWLSDDSAPASGSVYECEQYSIIGRNFDKRKKT